MKDSPNPLSADEKFWHLCQCPVLSELSAEEKAALKRSGRVVDVWRPNAQVPLPEDDSVCLLKMGYARLYQLMESGESALTLLLRPGDLFSVGGASSEDGAAVNCVTITPSCFLYVSQGELRKLIRRHSNAAMVLTRLSLRGARRIEVRLAETMLYPAPQRLARVLLEVARTEGMDEQGRLGVPLSATDLGRLCGTSREFATKTLSGWKSSGIVSREGRATLILDSEALERIARLS